MKQYKIKVGGKTFDIAVNSVDNGIANVSVNGVERMVEIDGGEFKASVAAVPKPVAVHNYSPVSENTEKTGDVTEGAVVRSPLPGVIIGISVNVGDKVSPGDKLVTLEAMKMENAIEAECGGTVKAIHVQKGDSVLEGAKIVTIG